jgi:hypothetical protein
MIAHHGPVTYDESCRRRTGLRPGGEGRSGPGRTNEYRAGGDVLAFWQVLFHISSTWLSALNCYDKSSIRSSGIR